MTVLQACGVALSLLLFLLQIGKSGAPNGRSVVFAAALLFFSASLSGIADIFSLIGNQTHAFRTEGIESLFKALGIAIVSQFTAELCRDAGEPVLASRVEFLAKVEIILLSIPLLQRVLALAEDFAL